jgi:hypothetical protein
MFNNSDDTAFGDKPERAQSCFLVAGLRLTIRGLCPDDAARLLPSYAPFACSASAGEPLFMMELGVGEELASCLSGETASIDTPLHTFGDSFRSTSIYRLAGGWLASQTEHRSGRRAWLKASADWSSLQCSLSGDEADGTMLDFFLMMTYGFAAPLRGALLMHASVVTVGERAALFLGASGTGKSTHASLWLSHIAGASLLNDDNPVVRIAEAKAETEVKPKPSVRVYGSPWSGKTPCYKQASADVAAILRLAQAPFNRLTPLRGAVAYAAVLPSSADLPWSPPVHEAVCRLVARLADTCRIAQLACLPDGEAARIASRLLQ